MWKDQDIYSKIYLINMNIVVYLIVRYDTLWITFEYDT